MPHIPLIAGNWKMHGLGQAVSEALAIDQAARQSTARIALFPPATLLHRLSDALADVGSAIVTGGQDCRCEPDGAFTGDISAEMLKDAGAAMVILGHSERRHGHHEPCALVAKKAIGALRVGLEPVICIGETLEERLAGETHAVLTRQLGDSLPEELTGQVFHVAYEPVWAIGTGHIPTDEQVVDAMVLVKSYLEERFHGQVTPHVLYGGSVKPDNAAHLLTLEGVGGLLVGGASLKAVDFNRIIAAAG